MVKTCSRCKDKKDQLSFYKDSNRKDGLNSICIECKRETSKEEYSKRKEKYNEKRREHYYKNKWQYRARDARRRASEINATPNWLTNRQKETIKSVYRTCQKVSERTGKQHHVDHIVPLKGENVCGLHVPWNLSIIPATMNLKKGNTHG